MLSQTNQYISIHVSCVDVEFSHPIDQNLIKIYQLIRQSHTPKQKINHPQSPAQKNQSRRVEIQGGAFPSVFLLVEFHPSNHSHSYLVGGIPTPLKNKKQ